MGLKTKNYENKDTGLVLPEAYALIKAIKIDKEYGTATFAVQTSRDNAFEKAPIFTKEIMFKVNRNENPFTTAYQKATEKYVTKVTDPETGEEKEVVTGMPFKDWQDDLVTE